MFVATGASMFGDPKHFPWTIGLQSELPDGGDASTASTFCATKPDAKIAVLYQNDGFGKDYLIGLKDGLGAITPA